MVRFNDLSAEHFVDQAAPASAKEASIPPNLHATVLNLVKHHPDGVSAAQIANALQITSPTIMKVLRELHREREIYPRDIGRTSIWYPNGRLIHPFLEVTTELRGKPYRFSVQEGRAGPIIQVQERSFSLIEGERVEGAVFVDYKVIDSFIEALLEMKRRFEHHEVTEVKK